MKKPSILFAAASIATLAALLTTQSAPAADAADVVWTQQVLTDDFDNAPAVQQQDSLLLRVRWAEVCDSLGCPDSYNVIWSRRDPRESGDGTVAFILAQTTPLDPVDSLVVPAPALGDSTEYCANIAQVRRAKMGVRRLSCTWAVTPDARPAMVDSIVWDSVRVVPRRELSEELALENTRILHGAWQYRTTLADGTLTDSLPLAVTTGRAFAPEPGHTVQICAMAPHRDGVRHALLVPDEMPTQEAALDYIVRCTEGAQAVLGDSSPLLLRRMALVFSEG